jgi:hypothetical protein
MIFYYRKEKVVIIRLMGEANSCFKMKITRPPKYLLLADIGLQTG